MDSFIDFLYNTYPYILLGVGSLGNFVSFWIFSRKRFEKNRISLSFRVMSILNTLFLINNFLTFSNSTFWCKMGNYFYNVLPSTSGWILVYASLLRYATITRAQKIPLLESVWFNLATFFGIMIACAVLCIPFSVYIMKFLILSATVQSSSGNQSVLIDYYSCSIENKEAYFIIILFALIFGILLPFFLMISISIALIYFVVFSRRNFANQLTRKDAVKFKRDVKLAFSVIGLDFTYAATQMPNIIIQVLYYNPPQIPFLILRSLFQTYFGLDFLVYFLTNSIFRKELWLILRLRRDFVSDTRTRLTNKNSSTQHVDIQTTKEL